MTNDNDDDRALGQWLSSLQGSNIELSGIINPSRGSRNVGALLDDAGADLNFDREPPEFYKLLLDLAPKDLTRG
ncbi:MAG: hypothetical protein O2944_03610 [Proteobacteria bacterium]|nr:hypothetical protein [Pseudomonadota bacterium]